MYGVEQPVHLGDKNGLDGSRSCKIKELMLDGKNRLTIRSRTDRKSVNYTDYLKNQNPRKDYYALFWRNPSSSDFHHTSSVTLKLYKLYMANA